MTELALTPKERQALKGVAHKLNPVVLLGADGLTPAVLKEIDRALNAHGLIKIRVPSDDRDEREGIFSTLADQLNAAKVQVIGKTLVLFRPLPEQTQQVEQANKRPTKSPTNSKTAFKSRPERGEIRRSEQRTSAPRRSQRPMRGR